MKITVITPCYNSAKTIESTIRSVCIQTHKNTEHIIIDGASTDGTIELIKSLDSPYIKLQSQKDKGLYDAINKGIEFSTGEIIGILNSDDRYYNDEVLSEINKIFVTHPEIDCLYGNLIYVDSAGKIKRKWRSRDFEPGLFKYSWSPAHPTFYCRRSVYNKIGKYKVKFKIASDVDFMLRVLEIHGMRSFFLNKTMVEMTIGGISNRNINSKFIIIKEMCISFKDNNLNYSILRYIFSKLFKFKEYFT